MKHAFCTLSVLSMIALGCGAEAPGAADAPAEGAVSTAREALANQEVLALTAAESGRSFDVSPGVFVTVTLPENPSTGYHWRDRTPFNEPPHDSARIVVSVFHLLSSTFTEGYRHAPGSGGIRVFAYQQSSMGRGSIKLERMAPDGTVAEKVEFSFMASNH